MGSTAYTTTTTVVTDTIASSEPQLHHMAQPYEFSSQSRLSASGAMNTPYSSSSSSLYEHTPHQSNGDGRSRGSSRHSRTKVKRSVSRRTSQNEQVHFDKEVTSPPYMSSNASHHSRTNSTHHSRVSSQPVSSRHHRTDSHSHGSHRSHSARSSTPKTEVLLSQSQPHK